MASLLIEFGADVQAKNFLNQTPLHTACSLGLDGVVRVLLENGGGETVLYDCEYVTQLDLAVKSGSAGRLGCCWRAVKWGFAEVVKVLIEAGVEVEETRWLTEGWFTSAGQGEQSRKHAEFWWV
ncbi:hypothetical protein BDD12DRAFT_806714 [Trichophaea hybrida]|nr:hypothetical protein BDD12DRAFT_806714 [Trichophaea hybrida]